MFKNCVSVLLMGSLLWYTVGCTSTKYITDVKEFRGKEIEVDTKGGPFYLLREWTSNASGDITGNGTVFLQTGPKPFSGTIPADSIVAVKGKKVDAATTAAFVSGVVGLALLVLITIDKSGGRYGL